MDIFLNLFRDEYESLEKNGVRNLDGSIYYYLDHVPWAVTFQSETLDGSSIKPLVEYIIGKDLITGEKLTEYEKNAQLRRAGYNMGSLGVEAVIASSIPGVGWAAVAGAAALAEVNNITGAATYSVTKKIVQELGGSDNLAEKVGKGAEFVVSGLGGKLIYDKFLKPRAVANAAEVVIEGGSDTKLIYNHNPMDNPKAAKDIIENPEAVYGYSPNPNSTRIGQYATKIDWTDPDQVAVVRQIRQAYHESNEAMLQSLYNEGYTTEEIAAKIVEERNLNRINSYIKNVDYEGLAIVKQSNLDTYGNEFGMTLEQALDKYGSYEEIINAAVRSNPGIDACTGLYDIYHGGD